ncbi:MAG: hypothetical protein JWP29_4951 [Rhodoferax sp.]|nr:hypothetical protein [Rhodoferax sp.]
MVARPGSTPLKAAPVAPTAGAAGSGIPLRALLVIGVLVLLAHWVVLGALPLPAPAVTTTALRTLTTRTVTLNPPVAPPDTAKPTPKLAPPKPPPRKPRAVVAKPAATFGPKPQAEGAAEPSMPSETALAVDPSPTAQLQALALALAQAQAQPPAPAASEVVAAATPPAPAASEAPAARPPREAPPGAAVLSLPGSARLRYALTGEYKKLSYSAKGQMLWLQDGVNYEFKHDVSAFLLGTRSQASKGQITDQGLAPTRYAESLRTEVAAHFERDKGRVTFSANTPEAQLLNGAQDRLSVIMQIVAMLAGDPTKYPPATTITVQTIGPRDAEVWLFTVDGEETVQLQDGPVQALKISRNPRREFDTRIELWFAPIMSYLPVRVKATQSNGDFIDEKLLEIEKP